MKYDSSWEYKYECYLRENNIYYIYQAEPLKYFYKNVEHKYIPDFKLSIGNETYLVEIKNDYLLNIMINDKDSQEHQKYLCMCKNNVIILTYDKLIELGIKL